MNWSKINQQFRNQFIAEADEHLQKAEAALLVMESGADKASASQEILRALHSLKGISGVILSMLDQNTPPARNLDSFRILAHLNESLVQACIASPGTIQENISLIFEGLDVLKDLLEAYRRKKAEWIDCSAVVERIKNHLEVKPEHIEDNREKKDRKAVYSDHLEQNLQLIETSVDQLLEGDSTMAEKMYSRGVKALGSLARKDEVSWLTEYLEIFPKALSTNRGKESGTDIVELKRTINDIRGQLKKDESKIPAMKSDSVFLTGSVPPASETGGKERTIRMSQEKIDELMNLIGELRIQSNALGTVWQNVEQSGRIDEYRAHLKSVIDTVIRLSDEVHGAIMSVRLLPLSLLFSRFPRLVRDLGKKLGKEVRLEIDGEDTVIDKNMIDMLNDPLTHLIRNAVDHGIEHPAGRMRAGKPEQGCIELKAYNRGRHVIIEVSDDGQGLDPDRIRKEVSVRGLCEPKILETMNDQKVFRFLFRSGFSLSETVSDISGRGVGLDVVNINVTQIGGSIDIVSHPGSGTRFLLQLPLTMAIGKGLLVECQDRHYYLPIDLVMETMALDPDIVFSYKEKEAALIRGSMLRLYRLEHLLGGKDAEVGTIGKRLLLLEVNREKIALLVDACYQEAEYVVKPLQGIVHPSAGFSGAVITGDGTVVLILDMATLLARFHALESVP